MRKNLIKFGKPELAITVLLVAALLPGHGEAQSQSQQPDLSAIPVCYDFGCKTRVKVSISDEEFAQAAGWLKPEPESPADERARLAKAVGWMEVLVGQRTPTKYDIAGNLAEGADKPGQLDCIDESHNTTTYMKMFEKLGLLRHHRVVERAYRRAIFDIHWSGQIEQIKDGERYVLDSCFRTTASCPISRPPNTGLTFPSSHLISIIAIQNNSPSRSG